MADRAFTLERKAPGSPRGAARPPEEPRPLAEIDRILTAAAESEASVQTILRETHVNQVLEDLDRALVALEPVKRRIREIAALLVIDRLRQARDLSSERPTLHMSFTGNPGTGKTTVALRMAEILHRLGYLEKGHVVSVTRDELVGQYVGHTAPKTKDVVKRSYGGVLFIDEAYYLHRPENERDYGAEAIEVLLQVMEADRDKLVVILAGYKDRMDRFFESNPGMGSRVAHHVDFPDYDVPELLEIAELMVGQAAYRLSDGARKALEEYVERRIEQPRFANGRSIRNAIDRARLRHAMRLFETDGQLSRDQLITIEPEDIYASSVFSGEVETARPGDRLNCSEA
jgi:probable Rubsico expression protein CbbX